MIKDYINLTKPGIILGNLVSATGAFLLGSRADFSIVTLGETLLGLAFLIGGGCAVNNCIDRDIDALMERTRSRPLVTGKISLIQALTTGALLTLSGLSLLAFSGGLDLFLLGLLGWLAYVVLYSLWLKRTPWGTWGGSLSGAMPPLIAYTSASGVIDATAMVLFCMYCLWQIPHAQALGIMYLKDYQLAGIPVVGVGEKGIETIKNRTPIYVMAFSGLAISLFFIHQVGYVYLITLLFMSFLWLRACVFKRKKLAHRLWAKQSFVYSLYMVMCLSVMMSVDANHHFHSIDMIASFSSLHLPDHSGWLAWVNASPSINK